mgnify:CR=1 FL=1
MNNPELAQEHSAQEPQQAAAIAENPHLSMLDRFREHRAEIAACSLAALAVAAVAIAPSAADAKSRSYIPKRNASKGPVDGYGGDSSYVRYIQKSGTGSPIRTQITIPKGTYEYGKPTPASVKLTYDRKAKYHEPGVKKGHYPRYSKFFRNNAIKSKAVYFSFDVSGGLSRIENKLYQQEQQGQGEGLSKLSSTKKLGKLVLRPGKSKTFRTTVTPDKCIAWPKITSPADVDDLESHTGFRSPPGDYPCTPASINVWFDAKIRVSKRHKGRKIYYEDDRVGGSFVQRRIKIANPTQIQSLEPSQ